MAYYKITRQDATEDAGYLYLKWNPGCRCMMTCEQNEAEFIQSCVDFKIYRANGLNASEVGAQYPTAGMTLIGETEFNALLARLTEGMTLPEVPEEPPAPVPEPEPEPEPEVTIADLQARIAQMEEMLNALIGSREAES